MYFTQKTKSAIDDPSFDNYFNKNMTATNIVSGKYDSFMIM